jgi:exopolysaccharide/PEP-CTERM locus tyrosine autokinase
VSTIEQAAKRLEEMRLAAAEAGAADGGTAAAPLDTVPTPEAVVRGMSARSTQSRSPLAGSSAPDAPRRTPFADASRPRLEIDFATLRRKFFLTPDAPQSPLADEFRIVKRPIMRNALGPAKVRNGNLVMVTSALPGEGKTYTAVNLAISVAMEYDTSVILVDGDVAHPDVPNIIGSPRELGLLDLLTNGNLAINDVVVPTNVPNLAVLPAGAQQGRATELLASTQMRRTLNELSTRYADLVIIFDSPPLLPTTEARELATHMGQILMVVGADSTHQSAIKLALTAIEKCEIVLMLLNKAAKTEIGTYGGYYRYGTARG